MLWVPIFVSFFRASSREERLGSGLQLFASQSTKELCEDESSALIPHTFLLSGFLLDILFLVKHASDDFLAVAGTGLPSDEKNSWKLCPEGTHWKNTVPGNFCRSGGIKTGTESADSPYGDTVLTEIARGHWNVFIWVTSKRMLSADGDIISITFCPLI